MKKQTLNPLKALAMFAVAFGLVFITSCGDDDDDDPTCDEVTWYEDADGDGLGNPDETMEACEKPDGYVDNDDDDDDTGTSGPTMNIWEVVESTEGLDSLEKYLNNYPDLVATLESEGQFTVFAPTNQAFINLLNTPGFPERIDQINPDIIKGVLAYHVVPGQKLAYADFDASVTLNTAYTDPASETVQTITFDADKNIITGSTSENPVVAQEDIQATNGVVHTTEFVLIPPSVGATLTPILGTNAGTLLLGTDFSILAGAIMRADAYAAENEIPTLVSILAGEDVNTVFAPSNATFEAMKEGGILDIDTLSGEQLYGIIANHVVVGDNNAEDGDDIISVEEMTQGATFTSAAGATLTFYVIAEAGEFTDIFIDSDGNQEPNAEVALPNAASNGNGVVHVVAGILSPPSGD